MQAGFVSAYSREAVALSYKGLACMSEVHRVRSEDSPTMSLEAAVRRRSIRSALALRSACSAVFSEN